MRLSVLGTVIAVPGRVASELEYLPRSAEDAVSVVDGRELHPALATLTRQAVEASPLLCIHAGVVSGRRGFVAIPGRSGLGKTTLTAALVRAGFGYVSDEALAVDRATGQITPFPRPLAIGADVWALFQPPLSELPPGAVEALVSPAEFGSVRTAPGRVSDVVLVRHRRPGAATLETANRSTAVVELLSRSFNHWREPEASFRAVVALVRQARVWVAQYAEAPDLADLLVDRLGTDQDACVPSAATEAK